MDDTPLRKRKWFVSAASVAIAIGVYVLLVEMMGGFADKNVQTFVLIDLACIFPFALIFWMVFFSQFVLPVNTFSNRQRIFDRLFLHLTGLHGPAIFVRDGNLVKSSQEEEKKGPGVLWLDSASGVVTRTDTSFRNSFGPGVHFTENNEKIAGAVDLHTQNHSIGPNEKDKPFEKKKEEQTEDEKASYEAMLGRKNRTSAWTRDGIEIVPNISVNFKIDADPVRDPNMPGSRFGFNEESVRRAIIGQAINPSRSTAQIPWNQLPALLAADIWRDLVGKFTLNDLFDPKYTLPPSIPNPPQESAAASSNEDEVLPQGQTAEDITRILRGFTENISGFADWLENRCNPRTVVEDDKPEGGKKKEEPKDKKVTGLQVINFLLKERLQKQRTAVLDRYGIYLGQQGESREFEILVQRGIRVNSASVSNLQLPKDIDDKLLKQWVAGWLKRAREERNRLDQREGYRRIENEETAFRDYIEKLSDDLLRQIRNNRAGDLKNTLRALLLESRVLLVNETQQFRQIGPEREELEELIQWLETKDL